MTRHDVDCGCTGCIDHNSQLEARAEARKEAREWSSDRDADMAADRYYGDAR